MHITLCVPPPFAFRPSPSYHLPIIPSLLASLHFFLHRIRDSGSCRLLLDMRHVELPLCIYLFVSFRRVPPLPLCFYLFVSFRRVLPVPWKILQRCAISHDFFGSSCSASQKNSNPPFMAFSRSATPSNFSLFSWIATELRFRFLMFLIRYKMRTQFIFTPPCSCRNSTLFWSHCAAQKSGENGEISKNWV